MRFDIKLLQLRHGQINSATLRVFAHVTDDVGQLKRQTQLVRVGGGLCLRLAKNAGGHFAHNARHQMAVALQACKIKVSVLRQVHLAAFNHSQQVPRFNLVGGG